MEAEERATVAEPATEGFSIPSPSDPKASYRIVKISKMPNGHLEVTNRRDGTSGTSFSRRAIDCRSYESRYLVEGATPTEEERSEERRVGKEGVCPCRSWVSAYR